MGRIINFVSGTILGTIFAFNTDEFYIRSIKNNLIKPVKSEISKDQFDLVKVMKISARGIKNIYYEIRD